jgi:hypothetical protein
MTPMHKFVRRDGKIALLFCFEEGDVLEYHEHTPENYHDVAVDEGRVRVAGKNLEWFIDVGEGETCALSDDRQGHQIISLSGHAVVANVYRSHRPHLERMVGQDWAKE